RVAVAGGAVGDRCGGHPAAIRGEGPEEVDVVPAAGGGIIGSYGALIALRHGRDRDGTRQGAIGVAALHVGGVGVVADVADRAAACPVGIVIGVPRAADAHVVSPGREEGVDP